MTPDFCVQALEEAIAKYGPPEIFWPSSGLRLWSAQYRRNIN